MGLLAFMFGISLLSNIAFILFKLRNNGRGNGKTIFGTILMENEKSLIVELDNSESLTNMYNSEYAVFKVKRK